MDNNNKANLIIHTSQHSVKTILDKIVEILQKNNVQIFARIDHAGAAKAVQLEMPDEELLVFGNPAIGTALMQENPSIGIELPLKILVWRDHNKTYIAFKDPNVLIDAYKITKNNHVISGFATLLNKLIESVK